MADFDNRVKDLSCVMDPALNWLVDAISTVSDDEVSSSETFNYIDAMKADMKGEPPEEVKEVVSAFYDMAVAVRELFEEHNLYDNPDRVINYVFKQQTLNSIILEKWDADTMAEE